MNGAFFCGCGAVLEDGGDGDDEETAAEAEGGEGDGEGGDADAGPAEDDAADGHDGSADGDEAVFDAAAAEVAGGTATGGDADAEGHAEVADLAGAEVEGVFCEDGEVEADEGGDEPEGGVAPVGAHEVAVAGHGAELTPEFGEEVRVERFGGVGWGDSGDEEAGDPSGDGDGGEDPAWGCVAWAEGFGEFACGVDAADDAEEGEEFEDAVAPAEFGGREDFGEDAVFRGAEDGAVDAHEADGEELHAELAGAEGPCGDEHDDDFGGFDPLHDGAFAAAVSEPAAEHAEEDEGEGEGGAGFGGEGDFLVVAELEGEDEVDDELFEGVVAEGALGLGEHEGPEAAFPGRGGGGGGSGR